MAQYLDKEGKAQEFLLSLDHFKEALDKGLTLPQYVNQTVETDVAQYGEPWEQMKASHGLFLRADPATGLRPATAKSIFGGIEKGMATPLVRPDGSQALTISGRLFFASTILEMMQADLYADTASYEAIWNGMVAQTQSVPTHRVDWPVIDLTAPRASRSQQIAQMAQPVSMAKISLSEKSARLPVFSIGLEVSHQALEAATIDFMGLAIREQIAGERYALIDEAIVKIVSGDTDWGLAALSQELVTAYDSTINAAGTMTQKAWLKWLRKDYQKLTITDVICDLDTYLAIEGRTNRPVVVADRGTDERLNVLPQIRNAGLPGAVNFFIVDTSIIGANILVGLDRNKAIKKWSYAGASYEAMEDYALRRSTAFRWDWSEAYTRIFDSAFKVLKLSTT